MAKKKKQEFFFIKGAVPSLKNGKQWTGKFLVKSKGVTNFLKLHGIKKYSSKDKTVEYYKDYKEFDGSITKVAKEFKKSLKGKKLPYILGFHFVRGTKHKWDFGNACEIISDLFTALDVWEDDNTDVYFPAPLKVDERYYTYNKDNPGVYITIENG